MACIILNSKTVNQSTRGWCTKSRRRTDEDGLITWLSLACRQPYEKHYFFSFAQYFHNSETLFGCASRVFSIVFSSRIRWTKMMWHILWAMHNLTIYIIPFERSRAALVSWINPVSGPTWKTDASNKSNVMQAQLVFQNPSCIPSLQSLNTSDSMPAALPVVPSFHNIKLSYFFFLLKIHKHYSTACY